MASSARYVKMTEDERKVYFMNKILAKCKYDMKCIDGVWHRRIKNGTGKWWPVVWPERTNDEYQESA